MGIFKVLPALIISSLAIYFLHAYEEYKSRKELGFTSECSRLTQEGLEYFEKTYRGENIILIGDSRFHKWPHEIFYNEANGLRFYNFSVGGHFSRETLCRIKGIQNKINGKVFILQTGINDLITGSLIGSNYNDQKVPLELYVSGNILRIRDSITRNNYLITTSIVPPIDLDFLRRAILKSDIENKIHKTNINISNIPEINLFDLNKIFHDNASGRWRNELSSDALHWNKDAYIEISKEIYQNYLSLRKHHNLLE